MTKSVSAVALKSPPKIAIASGARRSAPLPMAIAMGSTPSNVVSVVMMIGRRRARAASTIASRTASPCRRSLLIRSITTIALLSTIPTRMMIPISPSR